MSVGAGALSRGRVQFQRQLAGDNVGGKRPGAWSPLGPPRPAELTQLRGGEQIMEGRLAGNQVWAIKLRGSDLVRTVTTTDQLVDAHDADRIFQIRDISNPDRKGRWYVFLCEVGGARG